MVFSSKSESKVIKSKHGDLFIDSPNLDSTIGLFKIVILLLISFAGFAALAGHTKGPAPNNFTNAFAGTRSDIYGIAQCIYNVSDITQSQNCFQRHSHKDPKLSSLIRPAGAMLAILTSFMLLGKSGNQFAQSSEQDL